jgi:serine/threonine protein kinase/Leucine-rich repeat (LRR) protein
MGSAMGFMDGFSFLGLWVETKEPVTGEGEGLLGLKSVWVPQRQEGFSSAVFPALLVAMHEEPTIPMDPERDADIPPVASRRDEAHAYEPVRAPTSDDPEELQRHLPQYRVRELVGRGGMGNVIKVDDPKLARTVALKVMKLGADATEEQRGRFVREATVLARLAHPNIVPIYDLGIDDAGSPFYTMKLVNGRTLQAILKDLRDSAPDAAKQHTLDRLLGVFRKVCDAIAFAHSKGVLHRDLKPENIMVGEFGEVLVMDWGLAKFLTGEQEAWSGAALSQSMMEQSRASIGPSTVDATLDGALMGTPQYMSPEQAEGMTADLDERSDIFSLGAVLYAILTLHPPVEGKTVGEVLKKISSGQIAPPSTFGSKTENSGALSKKSEVLDARVFRPLPHCPGGRVPAALSAVTMKALSVDKPRRYQAVNEFSAEVEAWQTGFATRAENAGLRRQLILLIQRHKGVFTTVFAAWLIITALAVWFVINVTRAKQQAETERNRAESALADLRKTAPTFYEQALALVRDKKLDSALEKLSYALSLAPREARYHALRGNILQTQLELPAATAAYREAQRLDPSFPYLAVNLALCARLAGVQTMPKIKQEALFQEFQTALVAQQRTDEAVLIGGRLSDRSGLMLAWKQKVEEAYGQEAIGYFDGNSGSILLVLRGGSQIRDLNPLAGMPLGTLDCRLTGVTDLSPLRGMKLTALKIDGCKIRDLSPLEGMPLRLVHLDDTNVIDLKSLAGSPLRELFAENTKISDLSPLRGMPMEVLHITNTSVHDLAPLTGMKLRELHAYATDVTDATPLNGMPLKDLSLPNIASYESLRGMSLDQLSVFSAASDLSPLRGMPLKQFLTSGISKVSDLSPLAGMSLEVIRLYDTRVSDLSVLRGMPLQSLDIGQSPVRDLSPVRDAPLTYLVAGTWKKDTLVGDFGLLKGKAISYLRIFGVRNFDVGLLEGMPLKLLCLWNCDLSDLSFTTALPLNTLSVNGNPRIHDLSPLAKSKIVALHLQGASIRDLTPLRGLPLKQLDLANCPEPLDVSPLADCRELEILNLPLKAVNVTALRGLSKLHAISYRHDEGMDYIRPAQTSEQFWKEYDAQQKGAAK